MKLLNQYRVNLREPDFKKLKDFDLVKEIITDVYFLTDRAQYHQKTGLVVDNRWLDELLIT